MPQMYPLSWFFLSLSMFIVLTTMFILKFHYLETNLYSFQPSQPISLLKNKSWKW